MRCWSQYPVGEGALSQHHVIQSRASVSEPMPLLALYVFITFPTQEDV